MSSGPSKSVDGGNVPRQARYTLILPMQIADAAQQTNGSLEMNNSRPPRPPRPPPSTYLPPTKQQKMSGAASSAIGTASDDASDDASADASSTPTIAYSEPLFEVLAVFECPVCFDYMLPPYLQCSAGHLVCGNCLPKLEWCPICRGPFPSFRVLCLEMLADKLVFPCKHRSYGCLSSAHHSLKVEHESACVFRPVGCPCYGAVCMWEGSVSDVVPHVTRMHDDIPVFQGQGEGVVFVAADVVRSEEVKWIIVQFCLDFHFLLVLEKKTHSGRQVFYALVQIVGNQDDAERFTYRLSVSSCRRGLSWEGTPLSIYGDVASTFAQFDCLSFEETTAHLFAEDGDLEMNVSIRPKEPQVL